ncbi:hypothetical protein [Streptomyces sp. NPDC058632]|uniref:hypothetical protein n=1 Tax=Streptomyces sp. NPDC058632 TaxID=3346567 RepID=UPI0036496B2B
MPPTVLVVTALEDVTADRVVAALNARGVPVVRVDPADIGPDLTFGARIDGDRPAWNGWLRTASREVGTGEVTVPPPVEAALHAYLASFGLVFGCFDFALTGDGDDPEHWTAIECNPNGQCGWLPDAEDITEAFADLLTVERKGRS